MADSETSFINDLVVQNNLDPIQSTTNQTQSVQPSVEGYDFVFVPTLDSSYECAICLMCLREPYQTICGHRFCKDCIECWLHNNGQICPEDNKPLTSEDIFPDNRTRREIMQMKVKCPNHEKGCDKIITIGQVKDHLTECNYEKIICPNACGIMLNHQHVIFHCDNDCDRRLVQCSLCDEKHPLCELELHQEVSCTMVTVNCKYCSRKLKRGELQAHVDKTCPKAVVTCCFSAFGCNQMLERDSLLAHVEEKRDLHDQCLCETVHKLVAKSITSSQVISSRRNSAEPSTSVTYPYMTPNMIAKAAEQITEQNQQEKHNEGVSHYIQELFTRVVDLEQRDREMDIELKQMKRNMQKRDEELKGRFCNGVYVWTINNFFALKSEAMNGNPRVVHSAPFYTSPRGYKVCLRLNVHIVKDHHDDPIIALFMHLMKGEYDDDLHWPFHGKISLSLLNANNVDANIAHDMASVPELSAFKRPTSNRNLRGFGYSEFSTVSKLESENFINDDKLSIKASIVSFKE